MADLAGCRLIEPDGKHYTLTETSAPVRPTIAIPFFDHNRPLPQQVRAFLTEMNMIPAELSRQTGITPATISGLLDEEANPRPTQATLNAILFVVLRSRVDRSLST